MTEAPRLSGPQLLAATLDADSFVSWDSPVPEPADPDYAASLAAARNRTGLDESVITGCGTLDGRRVAVMVCEFGFLGGSIGRAATRRLIDAVQRATAERLPLLAATASGGTRMQEGTPAFVGMIGIGAALAAHKRAGLPYLVYLRHPTTGGVLASWGALGHLTVAEPGALIGFLGPRVYEALYGASFPEGIQVAENLYAHGLIDAVVPPDHLAEIAARALRVLVGDRIAAPAEPPAEPIEPVPAWESITRSRRRDRPGVRRLLKYAATDVSMLNGTGQGERDPGLMLALARFGGVPCVLLGQDRRGQTAEQPLGPGALREARRGMRLATELGLPLLTVIDTPGAALSVAAEEGGLAGEIARCLTDLATLPTPTVSVIIGQGTGGGALALLPADRVICAQHGWLSPLPPEGASAIIHRDTDHAAELAQAQGVSSAELLAAGIVDKIVPERPDAAEEPAAFCRRMGQVLAHELAEQASIDSHERLARRAARARG
ncbi:carboxyl transferase domain-containing protein [Naumannella huperziae]